MFLNQRQRRNAYDGSTPPSKTYPTRKLCSRKHPSQILDFSLSLTKPYVKGDEEYGPHDNVCWGKTIKQRENSFKVMVFLRNHLKDAYQPPDGVDPVYIEELGPDTVLLLPTSPS
ncbi:hypothetical protein BGX23_006872 [Mortierella sp. AD031]|nr:hypothetical protein BGX23_006872 [Mortierella sp. AD031]